MRDSWLYDFIRYLGIFKIYFKHIEIHVTIVGDFEHLQF